MGLHISVVLALAATVVQGAPLPTKNATLPKDNTTETATLKNQFPTRQWGIQRGWRYWYLDDGKWMALWTLTDLWTTMSGSAVATNCRDCGGSKAWQVYQSPGSDKFDMLRHVDTDLCLDAYWDNEAGKPKVHGYPCNVQNSNQHWDFDLHGLFEGWIRHRKFHDWILYGAQTYEMIHVDDWRALQDDDAWYQFIP
ncbi:hypothetical protein SPRG_14716 [Saprolegnia parasitica CBS 223.65]|uniref:Uncharacterized protein n=1 Tax=Saprolegnia parasitica (strain CBS 223.65) TaxID=695850 RepID=A0A067BXP1_SAPPC|nr:hypothetical protein SPRG_14716 [Saprolegnia parasitica CBS 223.65]KDO19081.1 hypothetical protein SPRG_14716 [Saprolegnia parasitica CBS 223.65]|eukprot:XP_012210208.1 hypothetical protein SPRG_14716 [Saprolegnia parasitica CBS 223.65]